MERGDTCVDVARISKRFDSVDALRDVSFSLHQGEIVGLVGPNGSGKTTLIRILVGLLAPDSGTVSVCGRSPTTHYADVGTALGVAFDSPGLPPTLTCLEYLAFFAGLFGYERAMSERRARQALERVGLADHGGRPLGGLSKGMLQRIAVGRSLINGPKVVLLDEPFDGIDFEARQAIMGTIVDTAVSGTAVLITSHQMHDMERLCSRLVVLANGAVVAAGDVGDLRSSAGLPSFLVVRLSRMPTCLPPSLSGIQINAEGNATVLRIDTTRIPLPPRDIVDALVGAGAGIDSMSSESPTLEDAVAALLRDVRR